MVERQEVTFDAALRAAAAEDGPDGPCAALDRDASRIARRLASLGMRPGGTLLVVGAPVASTSAVAFGGLRAGLELALAPPTLRAAPYREAIDATPFDAVATPAEFEGLHLLDQAMAMAHARPDLRAIFAFGGPARDGVPSLDEGDDGSERSDAAVVATTGVIVTFSPVDGSAAAHRQADMLAAAAQAAVAMRLPRGGASASLLVPGGFAGLVLGPLAALAAGASFTPLPPSALDLAPRSDAFDVVLAPAHALEGARRLFPADRRFAAFSRGVAPGTGQADLRIDGAHEPRLAYREDASPAHRSA
ncbi:MAG: hypothetical protein KGQ28_06605 [Hyphomicrobiales bacterium]|nr:hypothetical protein [Hyphomicrobiales bacterium]